MKTVFKRFRDRVKADVFARLFQACSDDPDLEYAIVDATIVSCLCACPVVPESDPRGPIDQESPRDSEGLEESRNEFKNAAKGSLLLLEQIAADRLLQQREDARKNKELVYFEAAQSA